MQFGRNFRFCCHCIVRSQSKATSAGTATRSHQFQHGTLSVIAVRGIDCSRKSTSRVRPGACLEGVASGLLLCIRSPGLPIPKATEEPTTAEEQRCGRLFELHLESTSCARQTCVLLLCSRKMFPPQACSSASSSYLPGELIFGFQRFIVLSWLTV